MKKHKSSSKENLNDKVTWIPDWRTILSAILVSSFGSSQGFSHVVWVCLIPWLMALSDCKKIRSAFMQGLWLSVIYGAIVFYFVIVGIHNIGGLSWGSAGLFCLPYFVFHQPQFLIFSVLWVWWLRRFGVDTLGLLTLAFAYVGFEFLLPNLSSDTLGNAFHNDRYFSQAADVGGMPLLTFICIFVNLALWHLQDTWRKTRAIPSNISALLPVGLAIVLVVSSGVYGLVRFNEVASAVAQTHESLNGLVIQANIDDELKMKALRGDAGARDIVVGRYLNLSREGLQRYPGANLVIWPETSYPGFFRGSNSPSMVARDKKLEDFVQEWHRALMFGSHDFDLTKEKETGFNAAVLLNSDLNLQVYHKNMLLMGGEYWPGAEFFPALKSILPNTSNFTSGPGPSLLQVITPDQTVPINATICYESIFPDYALKGARLGSKAIVNLADDSWFGTTNEADVHLIKDVFSSIETRLPQIITTNSGISALILPTGEIVNATELNTEKVVMYQAPIIKTIPTLMKRWGDWFGALSFVIALLLIIGRQKGYG